MVSDLKRLSPHLTGKPCAVKVARTVWRGLCLREGTRLPYERSIQWRTKRRRFTPEFKAELVFEVLSGESSQAEVCRHHNLNENQLSQWKRQLLENAPSLFESTDKQSSDAEKRIAHLEQLVGRMAVALDIQKKLLTGLD